MSSTVARCASCGSEVDTAARFCPRCGAGAPAMGSPDAHDTQVTSLLVSANLLRTRRQFEEAEEVCKDALAIAPADAGAHSLMGDIFMNQNRYKDAALWYQMALDLEPGSASVKSKLERADTLLKADSLRARAPLPGAQPDPQGKLDTFVQSAGFGSLRNIILIVGVCLFVIAVLAAVVSRARDRQTRIPPSQTLPATEAPVTGPSTASSSAPATTASPLAPGRSAAPPTGQQASTPEAPSGQVVAPRAVEEQFAQALQRSGVFGDRKMDLRGVVADPRSNRMFITVHVAPQTDQKTILDDAFAVAQQSVMADRNVENVTVRVDTELRSDQGSPTTQIAFVGDISRTGVQKHKPENDSKETMEAIFSNVYWAPGIAASTAGGQTASPQ